MFFRSHYFRSAKSTYPFFSSFFRSFPPTPFAPQLMLVSFQLSNKNLCSPWNANSNALLLFEIRSEVEFLNILLLLSTQLFSLSICGTCIEVNIPILHPIRILSHPWFLSFTHSFIEDNFRPSTFSHMLNSV